MREIRCQRGAALVEFALVSGLLMLLLFGIIEMGLIFSDQATLAQAAREAARSASLGSAISTVITRAENTATGLSLSSNNITLEKSADNGTTWTALGNTGTVNDAVTGNLIRVTVTYSHPLVTSLVFSGSTKTLTARLVMQRE